jgi:hypothetical protein
VGGRQRAGPLVETSPLELGATSEDEPGHLVCCRDPAWLGGPLKAWCGYEEDRPALVLDTDHPCTDCIAAAERFRPGWLQEPDYICPLDGKPCPDDLALLDLVARRVLPD